MDSKEIMVLDAEGNASTQRFAAGYVQRVNQKEGDRPLSFDLCITVGRDKETGKRIYEYINGITVHEKSHAYPLVEKFAKGQQLFVQLNVVESTRINEKTGEPYHNNRLWAFEYGNPPHEFA